MKTRSSAVFALLLLAGCQQVAPPASTTDAAGNTLTDWPLPAGAGAAAPDLFLAPDGRLLLSWVKPFDGARNALQYTTYDPKGEWQWAPKTIAVGASMVVDRMDPPHIAATADGALWAQWLQRTRGQYDDDGGHASFDVILARSGDDGMTWGAAVRPHDDGRAVEHGFVSFWPASGHRIGLAWLDGRQTADGGPMALRAASVGATGDVAGGMQIDGSVCDCCQTDAAVTTRGPLLVYRGRSPDEIRDIRATRFADGAWRTPAPVHADDWKMAACPVNGPAVAALGARALVAWYTAAGDVPRVQLAASTDAGDTFSAPVVADKGEAVQGRVDVALDARQAWVAWLREDARGQSLWLARYAPDLSRELSRTEVAKLQGRGRGTGVPKLAVRNGEAFLVWTDLANGVAQLHGVRVRPKQGG